MTFRLPSAAVMFCRTRAIPPMGGRAGTRDKSQWSRRMPEFSIVSHSQYGAPGVRPAGEGQR